MHKNITQELAEGIKSWLDSAEVQASIKATSDASDTGSFEVVITTENLDRYNEVIKLDGWELEHYMKNPVVLWGHDHFTLPIGVASSVEIIDGKMIAKGKFAPHQHAQDIRNLYDLGVVRATSVGFIEKERQGNLITKAELIEFSFVSVPANPYALSTLVKAGVNINELVTKGFMTVEKDVETEVPAKEAPVEPQDAPETVETPEPVAEKKFDTKALLTVKTALKDALAALEGLDETPEGSEATVDAPVEDETDEVKAFKQTQEQRRVVQEAATIIGDVLAEWRQMNYKK